MKRFQGGARKRHGYPRGNGPWCLALLWTVLLLSVLAGTAGATGPTREECAKAGIDHPQKLVAFVTNLQKAVRDNDKAAVIDMMDASYPFEISVAGKELAIKDAGDFNKHYATVMTKSLRAYLLQLKMDDITCFREGAFLSSDDDKRMFAMEARDGNFSYYFRP